MKRYTGEFLHFQGRRRGGEGGEEGERGEGWVGRQSEGLGGVVLVYKIGLRRPVIAMAINRLRETEN